MTTETQLEGRELDAAVAERVFNWYRGYHWPGPGIKEEALFSPDGSLPDDYPHYSSDPAAMMDVLRHMRVQDFGVQLRFLNALHRVTTERVDSLNGADGYLIPVGYLPLYMEPADVAQAALSALGAGEGGDG